MASVRADTYCSLFSLSVEHLDQVLDRYPHVRQTLEAVADERLRQLRDPDGGAAASATSKQRWHHLRWVMRSQSDAAHAHRHALGVPSTPHKSIC